MENFAFLCKSIWITLYMHIFLLVYRTYLVQNELFAFFIRFVACSVWFVVY